MLPGIRTLHLRPARQPSHLHQLRRHVRTVHTPRLRHRRNPIRQILPHHRLRRRCRSRRRCRCWLHRLRLRLHSRSRLHSRLRHRRLLHTRPRRRRRRRQINVRIVRIPLNHLHRLRLRLPTRPHLTTPHRSRCHIPRRRRLIIRTLHPTIPIPRRRRRRERIPAPSLIHPTRTQTKHGKAAGHNHGNNRTGGIHRRVKFHGQKGSQISPTITYPQPLASHSCIRIPLPPPLPPRRGLSHYSTPLTPIPLPHPPPPAPPLPEEVCLFIQL